MHECDFQRGPDFEIADEAPEPRMLPHKVGLYTAADARNSSNRSDKLIVVFLPFCLKANNLRKNFT